MVWFSKCLPIFDLKFLPVSHLTRLFHYYHPSLFFFPERMVSVEFNAGSKVTEAREM